MRQILDPRLVASAILALDALTVGFRRPRPHILIACMPKSGSTFLASAVAAQDGLRRVRLVPTWGRREQELSEIRLSRYNHLAYVAQHHVRNSEWTQELIARYGLTPIVLVRDLSDAVVSFRDHLRRESPDASMAHFTPHHVTLDDRSLEEVIVRLAMPWYINFYAGWRADPNAMFVDYEDLMADPVATIAAIMDRAGVRTTKERIGRALARVEGAQTRRNVGIVGRGRALSEETAAALLRLLDFYPELAEDRLFRRMRERFSARPQADIPARASGAG